MPIDPADPRLQHVAYAKLVGEGVEVYVRKFEVLLGRTSKSTPLDVVLGDNMNISRQHAKIVYNFDSKAFELIVLGKNGAHVNGSLYTPLTPPQPLRSRDLLVIGDKSFHFLLPAASKGKRPAPAAADAGIGTPAAKKPRTTKPDPPPAPALMEPASIPPPSAPDPSPAPDLSPQPHPVHHFTHAAVVTTEAPVAEAAPPPQLAPTSEAAAAPTAEPLTSEASAQFLGLQTLARLGSTDVKEPSFRHWQHQQKLGLGGPEPSLAAPAGSVQEDPSGGQAKQGSAASEAPKPSAPGLNLQSTAQQQQHGGMGLNLATSILSPVTEPAAPGSATAAASPAANLTSQFQQMTPQQQQALALSLLQSSNAQQQQQQQQGSAASQQQQQQQQALALALLQSSNAQQQQQQQQQGSGASQQQQLQQQQQALALAAAAAASAAQQRQPGAQGQPSMANLAASLLSASGGAQATLAAMLTNLQRSASGSTPAAGLARPPGAAPGAGAAAQNGAALLLQQLQQARAQASSAGQSAAAAGSIGSQVAGSTVGLNLRSPGEEEQQQQLLLRAFAAGGLSGFNRSQGPGQGQGQGPGFQR